MFTGTTAEFAELTGSTVAAATGFIRVLRDLGIAQETGTKPNKSGRGKASTFYSFPLQVNLPAPALANVA